MLPPFQAIGRCYAGLDLFYYSNHSHYVLIILHLPHITFLLNGKTEQVTFCDITTFTNYFGNEGVHCESLSP